MDIPAERPAPRRERRKDDRPAELLQAALEIMVERGFSATRLDDVATRAGVSKGTVYLYFDSKEALFQEVVRTSIIPALANAEQLMARHDGPAHELLRSMVWGMWNVVLSGPAGGIPKLMLAEARNFPEIADFYYREVVQRAHALVRGVIGRGVASGEFRPVDVDSVAHVLISSLVMLAVSRHSVDFCGREGREPGAYIEAYVDIALHGLRAPGSAA